jgi:hypothetical protein
LFTTNDSKISTTNNLKNNIRTLPIWPQLSLDNQAESDAFVRGKAALGQMFAQVVKPPSQGGTCGLKVVPEHTFVVGDTINVQWRADSPLLKEPYRGAVAYETHDGLMAAK